MKHYLEYVFNPFMHNVVKWPEQLNFLKTFWNMYVEFSIVFTEDDSGLKVAFQITFRGLAA